MKKPFRLRTFLLWLYLISYWFGSLTVLVIIDLAYRRDFIYNNDLIEINCECSRSFCIVRKATPEDVARRKGYEIINLIPFHLDLPPDEL